MEHKIEFRTDCLRSCCFPFVTSFLYNCFDTTLPSVHCWGSPYQVNKVEAEQEENLLKEKYVWFKYFLND